MSAERIERVNRTAERLARWVHEREHVTRAGYEPWDEVHVSHRSGDMDAARAFVAEYLNTEPLDHHMGWCDCQAVSWSPGLPAGLRPVERHAIDAILDRPSADPDDDAAIAARAAARLAATPSTGLDPAGLDVERLARAIITEGSLSHELGADWNRIVEQIAAEYDRLAANLAGKAGEPE